MAIFKCKMCGGSLEINEGLSTGICEYCGTEQTLPRIDSEKKGNLYDRADHFRRNNDYDKAMSIYEQILTEDTTDAEAYWSLVLCQYGIEYVEDPATHKHVPTINRAQFTSIFDDDNYKSAIHYADTFQRTIYEAEANTINEIQKGILTISQKEEPFDIFICYKETDQNGRRTQDSVLANDLYHQLMNEGFKVFFSRITLEDKLGSAYEPYIFAALNSAKVMVVLGTKKDYFNAVWVKNEWSRFLSIVKQSGGKKILIPAYRDMDPYDLPDEFSHLQAQDMSKLGFMQDLIRGIKKIVLTDEPKVLSKEMSGAGNVQNIAPLLKRAFMFLEDEEWSRADDFCEQVLNQEPENAQAYLGKLMAELRVRRLEDLSNCEKPFIDNNNYKKALRFGDEELVLKLKEFVTSIENRVETKRKTDIYNQAINAMETANIEEEYQKAAKLFQSISGFNDADDFASQCIEKGRIAEEKRRDTEERKVSAIVNAIKAGPKALKELTLEEKINESRERIKSLTLLRDGIGDLLQQASQLKQEEAEILSKEASFSEQLSLLTNQEENLVAQRKKLGIFAGKEKKRIDEDLAKISVKKCEITKGLATFTTRKVEIATILEQNAQQRYNLNSLEDVDREITMETAIAADLEERAKHANPEVIYSYEGALEVYLREPEIRHAVNSIFPIASNIDSLMFGKYVQKVNGAPEPIEWQVLDRDGNRILVISKYALEYNKYHPSEKNVTWESCSLRTWLNGTFLEEAFSEDERAMISSVTVKADKNPSYSTSPGNDTIDKVFLLGISEFYKYFRTDEERICITTDAADYAVKQGFKGVGFIFSDEKQNYSWWLRTPGSSSIEAVVIKSDGSVIVEGARVFAGGYVVRPAMWIDLES